MKKQFTTKLQKLRNAFVELFNGDVNNSRNDKFEILKKALLIETTTSDKIWLFKSLKAVFEEDLRDIEVNANRDLSAINAYNKIQNPETYAKSLYVNDPIFERKIDEKNYDYQLINEAQ